MMLRLARGPNRYAQTRGDDRSRTGVRGFAGRCLSHSATSPSESEGYQRPSGNDDGARPALRRGLAPGVARRSGGYLPPENVCIRFRAAGPSATTNIEGKTNSTVGKSIFTGAFIA